jgi:hypothetical protein
MRIGIWLLALLMAVAVMVPAASAAPVGTIRNDTFWIQPGTTGGGSGWDNGAWIPYGPWINQWFYNDPFRWTWKWIQVDFTVIGAGPFNWTLNWSSPGWQNRPDRPPLPGEDQFVVRYPTVDPLLNPIILDPLQPVHISYYLDLRTILTKPYNPEWVSIDIFGPNIISLQGTIRHQCMPTPAAAPAGLSLMGLLAMGWGRRISRRLAA